MTTQRKPLADAYRVGTWVKETIDEAVMMKSFANDGQVIASFQYAVSPAQERYLANRTIKTLAEEHSVSVETLKVAWQFSAAIDRVELHCGEGAKRLLLSARAGFDHRQILRLGRRSPKVLKERFTAIARDARQKIRQK